MIVIIDFGSGNLRSIQRSFKRFYPDVRISNDINLIEEAYGLFLPGVGSFGNAINELTRYNLIDPLRKILRSVAEEATYDQSFERFSQLVESGKI